LINASCWGKKEIAVKNYGEFSKGTDTDEKKNFDLGILSDVDGTGVFGV
jgi:hypothetical protein